MDCINLEIKEVKMLIYPNDTPKFSFFHEYYVIDEVLR